MSYAKSEVIMTYRFPAVAIDTVTTSFESIIGVAGRTGTVLSVGYVCTANCDADTIISLGAAGSAVYGTATIPAAATAGTGADVFVRGATVVIPADAVVTVTGDAGTTAGDADILIVISWA
jgi:hypothetical protein